MFFFIKPSVIHLDCFTTIPYVHDFYAINHSTKFYPEWWKKLPKTYKLNGISNDATMKSCVGFIEFYKNSISIPLWSDLNIKIYEDRKIQWQFANTRLIMDSHPPEQYKNFTKENDYHHLKLVSPWSFKTKKYIKWCWNYATYNFQEPDNIIVLPGILDFKYQRATNINTLINIKNPKIIELSAGTPLINLTPLTDKKVKIHNHLVDIMEYEKIRSVANRSVFTGNFYKNKKMLQEKESKCPFGFGKK